MNTRNDWEATLQMANEDLKQYGMEIIVRPDGPGMEVDDDYHTVFIKDSDEEEVFADNYYEHELGEVVNEAWAHARAKAKAKQPQKVWVVTFLNDCEWELPNVSVNVFGTEEEARDIQGVGVRGQPRAHCEDEPSTRNTDHLVLFRDGAVILAEAARWSVRRQRR